MSERVKWSELSARERDALVEQHVFGRKVNWRTVRSVHGDYLKPVGRLRHYTSSIASAWEVFTSARLLGALWLPIIEADHWLAEEGPTWEVGFCHESMDAELERTADPAEIPALICLTALRACGVEVDT